MDSRPLQGDTDLTNSWENINAYAHYWSGYCKKRVSDSWRRSHGKTVLQRQLRRAEVLKFFSKLEPSPIGTEACHGSHFCARELTSLGHTVRLVPTQYVKPFLVGGKNDVNDAAAICAAVMRSGIHFVAIKSAEQQSLQSVHRMRERLIQERTAKSNQIRSMFAEERFSLALFFAPSPV